MHDPLLTTTPIAAPAVSHFITAADGLKLHAVAYGSRGVTALPVVCLPGLARTAGDFHTLAIALASDAEQPRRVVAVDYRGRGRSEHDRDPANYTVTTELADLECALAALDIGRAVFIGTSRGGILTMLMAAARPAHIAGAVLNDIGPVIEPAGLTRIKGYVGKLPTPAGFAEGAAILRRLFAGQFPNLGEDDWLAAARLNWRAGAGGALVLNYDAQLARTLGDVDPTNPAPQLWAQFDALADVPVMVIRGGLSDILSAATVAEMRRRHPGLDTVEVADEGHPPRLGTAAMIARIAAFVRACDDGTR